MARGKGRVVAVACERPSFGQLAALETWRQRSGLLCAGFQERLRTPKGR